MRHSNAPSSSLFAVFRLNFVLTLVGIAEIPYRIYAIRDAVCCGDVGVSNPYIVESVVCMADILKLCVVCGEDCAGMPRTKDAQGQYYHKECFERELEARKRRRAVASPEPPPAVGFEPEPMSMLDEIVDDAVGGADAQRTCTSCGNSLAAHDVICMNCGFNAQTGQVMKQDVKKAKRDGGSSSEMASSLLRSPAIVSLVIMGILCLLLVVANSSGSEDVILLVRGVVGLAALAMIIFIWVIAFMESIGQGFLTLCLPFYIFYFILAVTDNQWAKWSFVAYIVIIVLDIVMFGVGM